jgi:hypothetical protein
VDEQEDEKHDTSCLQYGGLAPAIHLQLVAVIPLALVLCHRWRSVTEVVNPRRILMRD